jgi:glycosyltransferase involved in cell wall biosynthesis
VRSLKGSGFATRVSSMIKSYSEYGHEVDLFHYRFPHEEEPSEAVLRNVHGYTVVPLEHARLRKHCSMLPPRAWQCLQAHEKNQYEGFTYDIVQAETSTTWPVARRLAADKRVVVLHDDDSVRLRQLGKIAPNPVRRVSAAIDALKYSRWQQAVLAEADRIWFVSDIERDRLGTGSMALKSVVIPNGAADELWAIPPSTTEPGRVLFVGPGFYEPNVHGMRWFLTAVWPLVKRSVSIAHLRVAGVAWGNFDETSDVSFPGWCPSLAAEYAQATVCIAPLFGGGGTKLKVVEGMAAGRPVVTTPIGAEGVPPSEGVGISNDPDAFANEVIRFLRDPATATRAGASNRAAVSGLRWSIVWERAGVDLMNLVHQSR